ncbi:MAG TPA: hypothetical protein PKB06_07035 [Actinotalea sp.]|nr:hypothetical protein [Actinotalea sp.]
MTRPTRQPARATVAALLGVLAGIGSLVAMVAQHGSVLVHQCVADGTAGALGLRLALVRQDATCPSQLALGGDARQVFGVVVLIAVPVLAWHVAGLAASLGLLAHVRAGVRTVAQVLAGLVARPEAVAVVVPSVRCAPAPVVPVLVDSPVLAVPLLRGPPLATC